MSSLKETLEQLNSQGEKIFTVYLRDKVSAAGHAFNIQYDPQAAIFRFVDDNLGVVDCPNAEVFVESFSSWIFQAYSDFQLASLEMVKSL